MPSGNGQMLGHLLILLAKTRREVLQVLQVLPPRGFIHLSLIGRFLPPVLSRRNASFPGNLIMDLSVLGLMILLAKVIGGMHPLQPTGVGVLVVLWVLVVLFPKKLHTTGGKVEVAAARLRRSLKLPRQVLPAARLRQSRTLCFRQSGTLGPLRQSRNLLGRIIQIVFLSQ
jgi:hypothetical protein